mmetsp:Transcript_4795/g.10158  ORF Transcript_4795/g.10158 Transcript_4795/m.10158 type:complete len:267 (+) Transcript_4795:82-882(+)
MRLCAQVVDRWPVPKKDTLALADYAEKASVAVGELGIEEDLQQLFDSDDDDNDSTKDVFVSPFEAVLRSKGWVSLDRYPKQGVYWTHAGRHFGLEVTPFWKQKNEAGDDDNDDEDEGGVQQMSSNEETAAAGAVAGMVTEEDAFQELVFIGMGMDEARISRHLDDCLLTDAEMEKYEEHRAKKASFGLDPDVFLPDRRFTEGAKVEAFTGDGPNDGWSPGTVVGINYREPEWPPEEVAPYQILLDDDEETLIFAPMDDDRVVRELV